MRVFYPISARIAELANDQAGMPSGWMMLWSVFSIALLALVLSVLPSFEAGVADKQHDVFSNRHFSHAVHVTHAAQAGRDVHIAANHKTRVAGQDYIDAHRCAQYFACFEPLSSAAPAKSKAGAGLYL